MRFDDNSCGVSAEGVVEVVGEHDIASAPQLRAVLDRAASASSGSLRVDLSRASFVDSAVVAAIVDSARELVSRGRPRVGGGRGKHACRCIRDRGPGRAAGGCDRIGARAAGETLTVHPLPESEA
jgi:hypothetical protein